MTRTLAVLLAGKPLGEVHQDDTGTVGLEYSDDWLLQSDAIPLSLSLPLDRKKHTGREVWNVLAGLLPDNAGVIDRWARQFQVSAGNPVALLAHVGLDVAGAAQFVDPARMSVLDRESGVDSIDEAAIADQLRTLRADPTAWAFSDGEGHFSLAGAQGKFALTAQKDGWGVPRGSEASTHIFKPGMEGLQHSDLNEFISMKVARAVGLRAAETQILTFEDQTALVSTRFDRARVAGAVVRMHQEDMCQALGVHPSLKYQNEGGPTPFDIAQVMRRNMTAPIAIRAVDQFVDALAFNWLIAGTDAHAKNYSITFRKSQPILAPLYDVASAVPYPTEIREQRRRLAMKIGSTYKPQDVRARHWESFAKDLGLNGPKVVARVLEMGRSIPTAIEHVVRSPELEKIGPEFVERWGEAVTTHVQGATERMFKD